MRFPKFNRPAKAKGFTLVELLIVVIVIGVLMSIFVRTTSGVDASARATALIKAADDIGGSISRLASMCGVSTTVASNPLPDASKTLLDVMIHGEADLAAEYQQCWRQSSSRVLADVITKEGTDYKVQGFNLTLAGGGTAPLALTFEGVQDEVVLLAAQKYNSSLTALAASDTTGARVQYGTASGGARDLTILVQP